MTVIVVGTWFGEWDEAAKQLKRAGFTLTVQNTIEVPNDTVVEALTELWSLSAASVISGFSVKAHEITADSKERAS